MENKKNNIKLGLLVGLAGVILTIVSLFIPFAKSGKESKSLFDIARLYIESGSSMWNDKQRETFYKIFVPLMLGLIVLFAIIYVIKCIKAKTIGMIVSNILTIAVYELLKWDFADRGVVPGACDKGIAFTVMYVAFALMIVGTVLRIIEKKKTFDEC